MDRCEKCGAETSLSVNDLSICLKCSAEYKSEVTPLEKEIAKRFGILPNFFRLASSDPTIALNLWGFAQFAYLDNPLPSLFKERLFVYLSRFCEVRYCIARHVGFLAGLGYPAGDSSCLPQRVEVILPLLRRPLPLGESLLPSFAVCAEFDSPLSTFPEPDSPGEQALFACATHVFLQTTDAPQAHEALQRALGPLNLERLNLVLAFVRTAHYWTTLHPELALEDDISDLLATHEALAQCVLKDPEAPRDGLSQQVSAELASLRIQNRLASDLERSRDEIRALAASLMKAQEDERRRVSRELHDQILQQLASLASDIGGLVANPPSRESTPRLLKALQGRIVKASEEARHIAHELHPSMLDDLGLATSLRALCQEFSAKYLETELRFSGGTEPASVPREVASCVYRVAQESLQNIAKHSKAKNVSVAFATEKGAVLVAITDDGAGFDLEVVKGRGGLGLIGMEERVRLLNGKVTITARPGHGTQISLAIPVPESRV